MVQPIATPPATATDAIVRRCRGDETARIVAIVNAAAEAYRGVIPDDCFHDPYMPTMALAAEIADGVRFWGYEAGGELIGVMGIQRVLNVNLIRHAYVLPDAQGTGVGSALMRTLMSARDAPVLVGTWAAAHWAIGFYQRHGFDLVPPRKAAELLQTYWTVSPRQIETSVVLANPALS